MSQLKDFSQISQEQALHELEGYAQAPGVLDFVKTHQSIQVPLLEFISEIEDKFPDCKVDLKTAEKDGELKLRVNIFAPEQTSDILIKFNDFKKFWWAEKFEGLRQAVLFNILFPGSDYEDADELIDRLVGSIEGPSDWAAEIDHYLYGTPKRYQ